VGPFCFEDVSQWITERTPFYFQTTLVDERGAPITSATLATCVLTLYDAPRDAPPVLLPGTWPQDIKNVVGGRATISAQGLFDLTLSPTLALSDDTAILNPAHSYERRKALVEISRTTSGKSHAFEVVFVVRNQAFRA
jgi:hypothetical protein